MTDRFFAGKSTPAIRAIMLLSLTLGYPCRCLCLGLVQMTRTTPWRWITLHLSHSFFTDARTFIQNLSLSPTLPEFARASDPGPIRPPGHGRLSADAQNSRVACWAD